MSKALIDAAASYFGMDPARLAQGTMQTTAGGLSFTFKVEVSDDDYLGIADRMRAMREPVDDRFVRGAGGLEPGAAVFTYLPTLQEVMRDPVAYYDQVGCRELLERAMVLSKDARAKVEAEEKRRQANVQEAVGQYVWLKPEELTEQQRVMAVGKNEKTGELAVLVEDLTEEQKARRGVES